MNQASNRAPTPQTASAANEPSSKPVPTHSPPSHQPNPAVAAPVKPDPAVTPAPKQGPGPGESRTR